MFKLLAGFTTLSMIILFSVLPFIIGSNLCYASDTTGLEQAREISTDDGPHVYWLNDSQAAVVFFCNGSLEKQIYSVEDTLRFYGHCNDTSWQYLIPAGPHPVEAHIFNNVPKIMAISDIHGEYGYFIDILIRSGVIDKTLHWIWGDGHLVIDGDVFDRGDMVTECLWLIYRLEHEAKQDGGRVHFVLGNHELIVLRGDERYVHEKYKKGIVKKSRITHKDLYGPDMELGRWLRTKHTAIRINDILFTHSGIAPFAMAKEYDMDRLNKTVRAHLDLRSSQLAFNDEIKLLFGSKGPFWYRGYHYEMEGRYQAATIAEIDSILHFYGANTVVIGHTGTDRVVSLHDGRVMSIDVPFEDLGSLQALYWEDNKFYMVDGEGSFLPMD
jgi:hypothetical protein